MKKISNLSFNVMKDVRNSDEFKELSKRAMDVADQLQLLQIKAVSLDVLLKFYNLEMANKLGYLEPSDMDDFYTNAFKVEEYLCAFPEICEDFAYSTDLFDILYSARCMHDDAEKKEEEQ